MKKDEVQRETLRKEEGIISEGCCTGQCRQRSNNMADTLCTLLQLRKLIYKSVQILSLPVLHTASYIHPCILFSRILQFTLIKFRYCYPYVATDGRMYAMILKDLSIL